MVLSKEGLDRYEYDAIDLTPFPLDSCVAGYVRPLPLGEASVRRDRPGPRADGFLAKFRQNVARFRLYRHQFLQENTRFAAFFKIYQIF